MRFEGHHAHENRWQWDDLERESTKWLNRLPGCRSGPSQNGSIPDQLMLHKLPAAAIHCLSFGCRTFWLSNLHSSPHVVSDVDETYSVRLSEKGAKRQTCTSTMSRSTCADLELILLISRTSQTLSTQPLILMELRLHLARHTRRTGFLKQPAAPFLLLSAACYMGFLRINSSYSSKSHLQSACFLLLTYVPRIHKSVPQKKEKLME